MLYRPINGERVITQQPKSQFVLANFYFISDQFQIKRDHFSLIFPVYVQFFIQITVVFKNLFNIQCFKIS